VLYLNHDSNFSAALNVPVARVDLSKFPNGEKRVWIKDDLADKTVVIVQSFSRPVDEHIIELALLSDAARNLKARRVVALIPWMGYSPQDKEFRKGEPVSVAVIARIIESLGVDGVLTIDIHSQQSLNHFNIPTKEISALPLFIDYLSSKDLTNHVAVALDKGARPQAEVMSQKLNIPLVLFEKHRDLDSGQVTLKHLSGPVEDKHALSFDDFVSTGSTRISASQILKDMGALSYTDCITHAILANGSTQAIDQSQIDQLICTDTYPIPPRKYFPKLTVLPVAPLIASILPQFISEFSQA